MCMYVCSRQRGWVSYMMPFTTTRKDGSSLLEEDAAIDAAPKEQRRSGECAHTRRALRRQRFDDRSTKASSLQHLCRPLQYNDNVHFP